MSLLIRGGIVLTMNERFDVVEAHVSIRDGRIAMVAPNITDTHGCVIDERGAYVLQGFIQTHVHLCQTLFRGYADDLSLMDWLRRLVWPMEAAHSPRTLEAAAQLATIELLASCTTPVLTMETVHDTDVVFGAVAESGIRATIGKCMMDSDTKSQGGSRNRRRRRSMRVWRFAGGGMERTTGASEPRSRPASRCRARASCSRRLQVCPRSTSRSSTPMRGNRRTNSPSC